MKFELPPYTPVMEWVPTDNVDVLNVALPPLSVPVPSVEDPFLNVTVPAGVPPLEVTVAVKVTDWLCFDGFSDETTVLELLALFTVSVNTGEVLPLKFVLPPYTAVIEWLATDKVEVLKVALPLLSVPVPSVVEPSLKVTVPVGVPPLDVTVAVNFTEAPNVDGFSEDATEVELVAAFTVCVSTAEVLPPKSVLPPYTAVME